MMVVQEEIKRCSLDSDTFYKSIVRVDFRPAEKVTSKFHKPCHKKGDVIYERNFFTGFRKKVKKVFTEDTWMKTTHGEFLGWVNIHEYAEWCGLLVVNGELCWKPLIQIETTNKTNDRTVKFENNDDAIKYMREIKEKCKICGNNLL